MKRQPALEQIHRLSIKTLDRVFIAQAQEGLGCSLFEAHALAELVKEAYFPWLTQPEAIQAGQLAVTAVSAEEPGHPEEPDDGKPSRPVPWPVSHLCLRHTLRCAPSAGRCRQDGWEWRRGGRPPRRP
jgi:hypothetical protein